MYVFIYMYNINMTYIPSIHHSYTNITAVAAVLEHS